MKYKNFSLKQNYFKYFHKDVLQQDILERNVPYHVHITVRKIIVTSMTERVWVVMMDTWDQHVIKVNTLVSKILRKLSLKVIETYIDNYILLDYVSL